MNQNNIILTYLYVYGTCWTISTRPSRALWGMARPVSSCSSVGRLSWPDLSLGRVITRVTPVSVLLLSFLLFLISLCILSYFSQTLTLKKFFLSSSLAAGIFTFKGSAVCLVTITLALTFSNQTEDFTALSPVTTYLVHFCHLALFVSQLPLIRTYFQCKHMGGEPDGWWC